MKFTVCAIAKLENNYIREWVEHYLSIGFDKIILYDNNDPEGENLALPIQDYIDSKKVDIIDVRGKIGYQVEAYNDCYQKYKDKTDWILFVDIDEFLAFDNYLTIQDFLNSNEKFKNYNVILFNWKAYNDNDLITVENNNYSVLSRFTQKSRNKYENIPAKQLIRTNIKGLQINGIHRIMEASGVGSETNAKITNSEEVLTQVKMCDAWGDATINGYPIEREQTAYLKHFRYKTLQEFLELKCKRGYPMPFKHYGQDLDFFAFFGCNNISQEKLDYIANWLKTADISKEQKARLIKSLEYCLDIEKNINKREFIFSKEYIKEA